ncbi:hypothetical protein FOVG_13954 [Fusarium oxysporum f. sp. pisi HDV247]|uniref:Arylsulfatase n=1 Tax=Fusarium oxysporum f. sp. pisi HDV247 TaxID=1080344 RepID=W9NQY2_FUSOX|nr:hypothetical protein FOVG_13954 [Fusarium oxysporum f. sp. pisi HDV247]
MIFRPSLLCSMLVTLAVGQKSKPNIIFILTDDQDVHMQSMDYMPLLKKYIADEGTLYQRHYCTTAICCPARVSILTGKLAHNTNVTDLILPYGGYPKFVQEGLNSNYLPIWLQDGGYNTYYTGKLFNAHTVDNYNDPHPAGWTSSDFLLDPFTYSYWNATWQRDSEPPISHEGTYNTDDLAEKTINYIREAHAAGKPFFLTSAPIAPHNEAVVPEMPDIWTSTPDDPALRPRLLPPQPAKRHEHLFLDVKVPRTPNFNPDKPSGVNGVARLPKLNQTSLDYNDNYFRLRLQSLQAVDEMVERVVLELESLGIADDTYIIYTTDNGYHIGQHRLQPGKTCGFETDINVPLLIRGPGVPKSKVTDAVTSHTDLAPTILRMAGIKARPDFDGLSVPLSRNEINQGAKASAEHLGIEFWGILGDESWHTHQADSHNLGTAIPGNTYKGVRIQSKDYNLYYAVHCTNEHELYDMTVDPYQLNNLLPSGPNGTGMPIESYAKSKVKVEGRPLLTIISRLDAIMAVMKSCKGTTCTNPWKVLHPKGDVKNLRDALKTRHDAFYLESAKENSVSFSMCAGGYLASNESPQQPSIYGRDGGWSILT